MKKRADKSGALQTTDKAYLALEIGFVSSLRNLRFFQISKNDYGEKRYNYPIKKKIPLILLLNLFGIFIVSHFFRFVNIFIEI